MTVSELQSRDTSKVMNMNTSKPMTVSELQSRDTSKAMNTNTDFFLYHIL